MGRVKKAYKGQLVIDTNCHDYNPADYRKWLEQLAPNLQTVTKRKHKESYQIINVPAAFDIETSSWLEVGGQVVPRAILRAAIDDAATDTERRKAIEALENAKKRACLTCWQIGIDGVAWLGRTWDELREMWETTRDVLGLNEGRRLVVYVHNLGYEFQWLYRRPEYRPNMVDVFAVRARYPVSARLSGYGIELRDSLILSGLSLEKTGEELQTYQIGKLVGAWDYKLIRTTETPLTDDEKQYAIQDVLVVMAYIAERMDAEGGYLDKLPMTHTGYVRRDCKRRTVCQKDKLARQYYQLRMQTMTVDDVEYEHLRATYQGGYTHANPDKVGKLLANVGSYDFTSSYPARLVADYYPMGKLVVGAHDDPDDAAEFARWLNEYCVMFRVTLINCRPKPGVRVHILSESKCEIEGKRKIVYGGKMTEMDDNGRVYAADKVTTWVTELDFASIKECYDCDSMYYHTGTFTRYQRGRLPKELIDCVMSYYVGKTKFKGVSGKEIEYGLAKAMLNSIYGALVMAIIRLSDKCEDGHWATPEELMNDPDNAPGAQLWSYNEDKYRWTTYSWGVWCTAHARRALIRGLLAAGDAAIYADTDSIKYLMDVAAKNGFYDWVERDNLATKEKMEAAMAYYGYDPDAWQPKDEVKHERHPLGYWDPEEPYELFKTLGSKRYMVKYDHNVKGTNSPYQVTIAGANKQKATEWISEQADPFAVFAPGMEIPAESSGRNVHSYIDEEIAGTVTDHLGNSAEYHEYGAINITESEYTLSMSSSFLSMLSGVFSIAF